MNSTLTACLLPLGFLFYLTFLLLFIFCFNVFPLYEGKIFIIPTLKKNQKNWSKSLLLNNSKTSSAPFTLLSLTVPGLLCLHSVSFPSLDLVSFPLSSFCSYPSFFSFHLLPPLSCFIVCHLFYFNLPQQKEVSIIATSPSKNISSH